MKIGDYHQTDKIVQKVRSCSAPFGLLSAIATLQSLAAAGARQDLRRGCRDGSGSSMKSKSRVCAGAEARASRRGSSTPSCPRSSLTIGRRSSPLASLAFAEEDEEAGCGERRGIFFTPYRL